MEGADCSCIGCQVDFAIIMAALCGAWGRF
jgi:hypothetical protein